MDKVHECTKQLIPFFDSAMQGAWDESRITFEKINQLENEADDLKKKFRMQMHKDLFLPVPRSDLLYTLMLQDRIANKVKDLTGLVLSRNMQLPEPIRASYKKLLDRCIDATNQAHRAINELDGLLEAGFKGNEVKVVSSMLDDLDDIEKDTDDKQRAIRQEIFKIESDLPPIDCIFLYKMIEWTGDLADRAHNLGGQLQILLAQ